MHLGPIGIEDAAYLDLEAALSPVGEEERLSATLALVIAGADTVGVHMSPVGLRLGVDVGVPVHLAGGGLEDAGLEALGQAQHVDGPVDAGLDGLHRVMLIMNGRSGTGQVVDLVHFHKQREGHVMAHQLKTPVIHELFHIGAGTGKKVVHAEDFMPLIQQTRAQMRSQKARTARHKNPFPQMHGLR